MQNQLLVSIQSEGAPEKGQKNRSSANFQFTEVPAGTLQFLITENANAPSVAFNVMQDRRFAIDPVIVSGIRSGRTVSSNVFEADTSYYIADPTDTGGQNFEVMISVLVS